NPRPMLKRRDGRWRHSFLRIAECCEGIARRNLRARSAPLALRIAVKCLLEALLLSLGKLRNVRKADLLNPGPFTGLDRHFQRRRAKPVKEQPSESFKFGIIGKT